MENNQGNQKEFGERDYIRVHIHWMKLFSQIWSIIFMYFLLAVVYWFTELFIGNKWNNSTHGLMNILSQFLVWGQILIVIFAIPFILIRYKQWKIVKYYLRPHQLLIKKYNNINVLNIHEEYAIRVKQSRYGIQKWLNYGTLEAYDPDSEAHIKLDYVINPYGVVKRLGGKYNLIDDMDAQDKLTKPKDLFEEIE